MFLAANAARSGFRVEYRLRHQDGRWRWALDSAVPRNSADGAFLGYIGSVIDISERKEYEDAIAASEARFRTLVNAVPQHVWTCTPEGYCDYVSAQYIDYTGVAAEQLHGAGWLGFVHPDDQSRVTADWRRSLSEAVPYDVEIRIRGAGGSYRWFKTRAVPLRDAKGRTEKWLGTNTDVDDQKRSEAALLRANFDLSQFAYSASHDLQEPLRTVALYGQLLRKRHEPELSAGALDLVTVIEDSARRISALVRDLLAYTQTTSEAIASKAECDAGEVLASVMADLRAAIEAAQATVNTEHLPTVGVASPHLHTVFVNLLSNAIKYRGAEPPQINITAERSADGWLFTVADNGIGIEEQYREQVFGMFKRLHSTQYPGTGMGLALCRKSVEHYGGGIWVDWHRGGGTSFRFTVPHAAPQPDTLKNE
jgi:PAS domain S-box-containing protein